MTSRTTIKIVAFLLASCGVAFGQSAPQPARGWIDLGVRVTDINGDQARFQRFRDIGDGAFINQLRFDRAGRNWAFEGTADYVGRLDQRFFGRFERGGRLKASFEWNQIPLYISGDTRTLYSSTAPGVYRIDDSIQRGIEGGRLTLEDAASQATRFDTKSRRDTATFNLTYSATKALDLNFELKSTQRNGAMPFTPAFGFSDVVELAAPIDTRTTDVESGIEWSNEQGMIRVGYEGSWFDNKVPTLIWDNPLKFTDSTDPRAYATGLGAAQGRYALWPSSSQHGVTTAGSLKLPAHSRLTGNVTLGAWNQNQPLVPFTINTAIQAIPLARATAEAEARTVAINSTFTSRPAPYVWLNARFRYYDFDNRTPPFVVDEYVRLDQVLEEIPHVSQPLSTTRHNVDLDTSVTAVPFTSINIGYSRDWTDRTHRIFARTTENVFRVSVDSTRTGWVSLRGIFERAERNGSGFDLESLLEVSEQPGIRHFDIADRNRNRVSFVLQVTPVAPLAVSATLARGADDYVESTFGLQDNQNRAYTFAVDLVPRDEIAVGVSYAIERYTALQRSRNASPGAQFVDPTRDWFINSGEKARTVLTNVDLLKLVPKTEVRLFYNFSRSNAHYTHGAPPGSTLSAIVPLPPIRHEIQTATADLRYFVNEKLALGVMFWRDQFRVDDFSLGPATISQLNLPGSLFLGYVYRPYTANFTCVRLMYFW